MWTFCTEGNIAMVDYMLSLTNMHDSKMADGTTAFVMALARKDVDIIALLLAGNHSSDIVPQNLAGRAILELDRALVPDADTDANKVNLQLRRVLQSGLEKRGVCFSSELSSNLNISSE